MARINVGRCREEERGVVRKQLPSPVICGFALFCYILGHFYFRHVFLQYSAARIIPEAFPF